MGDYLDEQEVFGGDRMEENGTMSVNGGLGVSVPDDDDGMEPDEAGFSRLYLLALNAVM
jgi:hypothetical protein